MIIKKKKCNKNKNIFISGIILYKNEVKKIKRGEFSMKSLKIINKNRELFIINLCKKECKILLKKKEIKEFIGKFKPTEIEISKVIIQKNYVKLILTKSDKKQNYKLKLS